jgi:hypothetical protein
MVRDGGLSKSIMEPVMVNSLAWQAAVKSGTMQMEETMTKTTAESWETTQPNMNPWKPGLPNGPLTQEMLDTYEVYFSPGGAKWHRVKDAAHAE